MKVELVSEYFAKWKLSEPVLVKSTFTSEIFRVQFQNAVAILKVFNEKGKQFESIGSQVLRCFDGNGAVKLLEADEGAHLLEFISGRPLVNMVAEGDDEGASRIVCEVIEKLHSYSGPIPERLISMKRNFRSLFLRAQIEGDDSIYALGALLAERLIETQRDIRVLHGDIHHENILESPERGWLAIDPQCLAGERTYDVANMFYNPNGFLVLVESEERIERCSRIFSEQLDMDRRRILEFAFAYGCLSAAWCIEDGQNPDETLRIAGKIQQLLDI